MSVVGDAKKAGLLWPDDLDDRLSWPPGQARRMARRKLLPHVLLPDGSIRFEWDKVRPFIGEIDVPCTDCEQPATHLADSGQPLCERCTTTNQQHSEEIK